MSTVKSILSSVENTVGNNYRTANTRNLAGGKAWKKSNKELVEQLSMTGTLGNSFYVSQDQVVEGAIEVLEKSNAADLASAIAKGRREGFVRTFNILGLVYLSMKDTELFKAAFQNVIITGNDLEDFINMAKRVRKGFGRAVKSAMHTWIKNQCTPYYALKYGRQIADAIRISRFSGKDAIYDFVMGHYKGEANRVAGYEKYEQLGAYKLAKEAMVNGDVETFKNLVVNYRLDVASLYGVSKPTSEMWDALGEVMPVMMFLKYLNKLDVEGVFKRNPKLYKKKLSAMALKNAKVFPFRIYTAYINVSNLVVKNHLAYVLNEYTEMFDWSDFDKGSWAICPDVSASMTWQDQYRMVHGSNKKNTIVPSVIAGMFTGFLYKGLEDSVVVPWGSSARSYSRPKADSIITHIDTIVRASGGGTYMEAPIEFLLNHKTKVDNVLVITDGQEWGRGFLNAWGKYKKFNPGARAFLLRVDAYPTSPLDDVLAERYDITQIFGWSDNVVKFIQTRL